MAFDITQALITHCAFSLFVGTYGALFPGFFSWTGIPSSGLKSHTPDVIDRDFIIGLIVLLRVMRVGSRPDYPGRDVVRDWQPIPSPLNPGTHSFLERWVKHVDPERKREYFPFQLIVMCEPCGLWGHCLVSRDDLPAAWSSLIMALDVAMDKENDETFGRIWTSSSSWGPNCREVSLELAAMEVMGT